MSGEMRLFQPGMLVARSQKCGMAHLPSAVDSTNRIYAASFGRVQRISNIRGRPTCRLFGEDSDLM